MPELTVKLGDQILQTCRFDDDLLRIGRSRENDIVLENLSVSRDHVQIRFHDNKYILTDMNSANGTLVNGIRVTKTEIVDEDVITVGKHKLHFKNPLVHTDRNDTEFAEATNTVMVEPRSEAWLVVESGRLKGREFRITRFETSLGKAANNDVVLTDDWLLGKKQAIILRKGNNSFEVHDLGGLRRVKVNGVAIDETSQIKDGDTLELGGTKLIFRASCGHQAPTGRVPKEMPADNDHGAEGIREAGSLNGARRLPSKKVEFPNHLLISGDESLDLEEGYQSVRITLKDKSSEQAMEAAIPLAPGDSNIEEKPVEQEDEIHADAGVSDETVKTPVVGTAAAEDADAEAAELQIEEAETPVSQQAAEVADANDSQPAHEPEPSPPALTNVPSEPVESAASVPEEKVSERSADKPFKESRSSTGRRRRKHHVRAMAQKQSGNGTANGSYSAVQAAPQPAAKTHEPGTSGQQLSQEQEIKMWEEALQNPSPAIQRQAARMLKKLTGRDNEG